MLKQKSLDYMKQTLFNNVDMPNGFLVWFLYTTKMVKLESIFATLLVLVLHVKHLHCNSMSIITFIQKHHAMIMCHFM